MKQTITTEYVTPTPTTLHTDKTAMTIEAALGSWFGTLIMDAEEQPEWFPAELLYVEEDEA